MSGPASLWGRSTDRPTTRNGNSSRDPLFPDRSEFVQALIDVLALLVWMFFGALSALVLFGPLLALVWMILFS